MTPTETERVPVDVVFDNMPSMDHIAERIRLAASILESLHDRILYCRVVVTGPNEGIAGRYHVQIMVTLSDKVFVVRSNLKSISSETDLYEAIPVAFDVTLGKIRKHLSSRGD
jgi:hypothetical protein